MNVITQPVKGARKKKGAKNMYGLSTLLLSIWNERYLFFCSIS